ncbi:MAG: LysM peptidoglycan-binding domain-containing protein [Christensenellales bacterium]|jgi:LysM repeat protein
MAFIRMCPPGMLRYVAQKGDTVASIAEKNGLTASELAAANRIGVRARLMIGQVLCIPPAKAPKNRTYTLKRGDTLQGVARAHGITMTELLRANAFIDPAYYLAGQQISIPDNPGRMGNCIKYRVSRSETVIDILNRIRIPLSVLQQYNPGVDISRLREGQVIIVPESIPGRRCPYGIYYIIQDGDTLLSIARNFDISTVELLKVNRGLLPRDFTPGRMICLPKQSAGQ